METREGLLKVMQTAVQMEIDGGAFYLKAAALSGNTLGVKLFNQLAAEEDMHRRIFERIASAIQTKQGWGDVEFHPSGGARPGGDFIWGTFRAAPGPRQSAARRRRNSETCRGLFRRRDRWCGTVK